MREKKKPRGRPFQKGVPRPPNAGRKKGTPNRVTRDVNEFISELVSDSEVQESIRSQILCGKRDAMRGFLGLLEHKIGKAKATLELDASPSMSRLLSLAMKENAKEDRETRGRGRDR